MVILTPHVDAIRQEFGPAFSEWHLRHYHEKAVVEWRDVGGTSDAVRFVLSEFAGKPDGIGIDCLFGGGQEPYLLLSDKNLALRYKPPAEILKGIPQNINGVDVYDPSFTWFGAALSSFGILQNTRVQRLVGLPFVQRWEELDQPRLYEWVGAGDPRNSGTMNVMFEAFLQFYGWERGWQVLMQIGGNVRKFDRVSSTTAKDVTLGETAYAFAIDFYGFAQVAAAGRTNLTFVLPQDFTAVNPDGIAILKGAPHLVTAQRFLDFVLSEDGQKLWFLPRGYPGGPRQHSIERMSIRPDFYTRFRGISNIDFSPFDLKQSFRYNAKLSRERRDVVAALVGALLVDTHRELQAAWRSLIQRSLPPAELLVLGRVPLSEAEALQLATTGWKDPAVRTEKKIEWQSWAQRKYRSLAEERKTADAPLPRRSQAEAGRSTLPSRITHHASRSTLRLPPSDRMRVSIRNLGKKFGDTVALTGVRLEIQAQELFFLLGPSGCGKTTLLRLLAGFYQPDEGEIFFGDRLMNGVPPHKRNTGMVFQNYALWPHMNVAENVVYGLEVRAVSESEKKQRVAEALAIVQMEKYAERTPNQLSGGQQQRVALARALVIKPDVLLLDEPLSNLDAKLRLEMREEIRRIHARTQITTIYVTHDQKEALSMADRMAVLREGVIEQAGDPRAIYRSPATRFVADFIGETNWLPAEVQGATPDEMILKTDFGTWRAKPSAHGAGTACPRFPRVGAQVWLGFRPEAVSLGPAPANVLQTTITHVSYLGEIEQYGLEVSPGQTLKALEQNPVGIRQIGTPLTIHVRPQDIFVLPQT